MDISGLDVEIHSNPLEDSLNRLVNKLRVSGRAVMVQFRQIYASLVLWMFSGSESWVFAAFLIDGAFRLEDLLPGK